MKNEIRKNSAINYDSGFFLIQFRWADPDKDEKCFHGSAKAGVSNGILLIIKKIK